MALSSGRPLATGLFGLLVLAVLVWQPARSLTELAFEVGRVRPTTLQRAWRAPLEPRIRNTLAVSGTPFAAYRLLRDHTEEGARIYFLAKRSERSFRVFNRLSALLYPRVLVYVCDSEDVWQPQPDPVFPQAYILAFDTRRDVGQTGARPLASGDEFPLWKLEG